MVLCNFDSSVDEMKRNVQCYAICPWNHEKAQNKSQIPQTPAHGVQKATMQMQRRSMTRLLVLFHELDKRFLVYKPSILPVLRDAEIPQTQLGEALIDQVDGRMHV